MEEFKTYYSNGQLCIKCFFKNNKLEGEYLSYYSNGQLHRKCFYKNDKCILRLSQRELNKINEGSS